MDLRRKCYECNYITDDYNVNKYAQVICGDCGDRSHCFCDECAEYVPNSACTVYVKAIEVNKVLCDGCNWEINNEN